MDEVSVEADNTVKIRSYLNFCLANKILTLGIFEKEVLSAKLRQSSRERIITDSRGLVNLSNKELLEFFNVIHENSQKILSSNRTASAMRKNQAQLGARPKEGRVNSAAVDPSGCRICGKSNHETKKCFLLRKLESAGRRRVLLMKSHTCFGCLHS